MSSSGYLREIGSEESMTKVFRVALALAIVLLFGTTCTSNTVTPTPIPTVVEPGLAYANSCKPPCWQGLVPGQSTGKEAEKSMEQLRASGWASHIDGDPSGGYDIRPSPYTHMGSIQMTISNDTVRRIYGTIRFDYSVGKLTEQFGDPEWLYVVNGVGKAQRSCADWQAPNIPVPSAPVHVLYPQQGLWFLILVPENGLGLICPEMKVTAFAYYPPRSIGEVLTDKDLTTLIVALSGVKEQDLTKWHGFGGGY